jgi:DNA-binding IclR family transcriptional regulator
LGIADLLQEGPKSCTELAEATQTHAGALYRVLRALASVSVFVEDEAGRFSLTPLAEPLRTDAPGSLRAFAIMLGALEHWRAWEGVLHSVRTGQPAFDHVFGIPLF